MIKKILVAYDASEQSEKAFEYALDLAQKYEAKVVVLSVATYPEPPVAVETQAILENASEYYDSYFGELRKKADALNVPIQCKLQVGHPAEQIIHHATEEQADTIVMGHRGKTFVERWMLGSVCKRVLSYAPCTVIIVR